MQTSQQLELPGPTTWRLFRLWAGIGLQSFGGGASTQFMIQTTFVEKYSWISIQEYMLFNSQCFFTPGINLVALTILIGRKLGGLRGMLVSLAGMLLPSVAITCLLTAGFSLVQNNLAVQAIMRGVVPATAGLMLLVGLKMGWPSFQNARAAGLSRLLISLVLVLACLAALVIWHVTVVVTLLATALIAMLCFTPWRAQEVAQGQGEAASPMEEKEKREDEEVMGDD